MIFDGVRWRSPGDDYCRFWISSFDTPSNGVELRCFYNYRCGDGSSNAIGYGRESLMKFDSTALSPDSTNRGFGFIFLFGFMNFACLGF